MGSCEQGSQEIYVVTVSFARVGSVENDVMIGNVGRVVLDASSKRIDTVGACQTSSALDDARTRVTYGVEDETREDVTSLGPAPRQKTTQHDDARFIRMIARQEQFDGDRRYICRILIVANGPEHRLIVDEEDVANAAQALSNRATFIARMTRESGDDVAPAFVAQVNSGNRHHSGQVVFG